MKPVFVKKRGALLCGVLLVVMLTSGCQQEPEGINRGTDPPPVRIEPLFLPGEKEPELVEIHNGYLFQWPGKSWQLFRDETGFFVLDHLLEHRVELHFARRQLKGSPVHFFGESDQWEFQTPLAILPLAKGFLLTSQDDSGTGRLTHVKSVHAGETEWLTDRIGGVPEFIISPDGSKVAYRHHEQEFLVVYHVLTGRRRNIPEADKYLFCEDWTSWVRFSPLGGYLTLELADCETSRPYQFITFGADTGRLIHQSLPGLYPRWDPAEKKIAFFLHPDAVPEGTESDQVVQLGLYSLDQRSLQFLNRVPGEYHVNGTPMFSRQSSYLLYSMTDGEQTKLVLYFPEQQVQQTLQLPGHLGEKDPPGYYDEPVLMIPFEKDGENHLFFHDFELELSEVYPEAASWKDPAGQDCFLTGNRESGYYYLSQNKVIHLQRGSRRVISDIPAMTQPLNMFMSDDWLVVLLLTEQGDQQAFFLRL